MNRILSIIFLFSLLSTSFTNPEDEQNNHVMFEGLQIEHDNQANATFLEELTLNQKIFTFFTFQKEDAEEAMNFYIELFDNSKIIELERWGKEGPGKEGTIMHATFSLNGVLYMCSDSPPIHNWDFSPAVSNFVECEDENEIEKLFTKLSENGEVKMPLNNYGFSQRFGWVEDKFGISWQLNLK